MEIYPIDLSIYATIASYVNLEDLPKFILGLSEINSDRFWQYLLLERYPESSKITGYINYREYYTMILYFDENYEKEIRVTMYNGTVGYIQFMYISRPVDNKQLFLDQNFSPIFDANILVNLTKYKLIRMSYKLIRSIITIINSANPTFKSLLYHLNKNYITGVMLNSDLNKGFLNVNDLKFRKKLGEIKNFISS